MRMRVSRVSTAAAAVTARIFRRLGTAVFDTNSPALSPTPPFTKIMKPYGRIGKRKLIWGTSIVKLHPRAPLRYAPGRSAAEPGDLFTANR
jgi:hypothetical protein